MSFRLIMYTVVSTCMEFRYNVHPLSLDRFFITVRQRSFGEVMFSIVTVILSVCLGESPYRAPAPRTYLDLFNFTVEPPTSPRYVHYVTCPPVGKQGVNIGLKYLIILHHFTHCERDPVDIRIYKILGCNLENYNLCQKYDGFFI